MTRVCMLGTDDVNLEYELLSRETARNALATYDLREPYRNSIAVETVSLGAAVALLNDLDWYLVRFAADTMVFEPSVSESEWLSRELAAAIRDDEIAPENSGRFLKLYGVEQQESGDASAEGDGDGAEESGDGDEDGDGDENGDESPTQDRPPALVEPMYVTRTGPDLPEYDLQDVAETLTVRVTKSEFEG
ncbi:hypothetical protein GJ629_05560 [Halapricum sp. CBA1109]|uniref:DUF5804 family protein n=1 Tax=Halapricum sp. CBA1109 TaxID=2668068 RepID=UPI0012F97824|nr:DUF5804 family protein [Halapricum sp. CBA1109]MUV89429.1 hypothetical protein [Halapricum sp. CBA1109]